MDSNHKGNIAELAIAKEAADVGLMVLKPLTEHERYDLVLGVAGRLLRVQCKWANKKGDVVAINLARSRRGPNVSSAATTLPRRSTPSGPTVLSLTAAT